MSSGPSDTLARVTRRGGLEGPARALDLAIGIALTLIAAGVGVIMLGYVTQLGQLSAVCDGVEPDGVRCSPGYLGAMSILGTALVVFGWFLPAGFLVVRAVRRRTVFWLPLLSIAVMIASFYLIAGLLSAYLPPGS